MPQRTPLIIRWVPQPTPLTVRWALQRVPLIMQWVPQQTRLTEMGASSACAKTKTQGWAGGQRMLTAKQK